MSTDILGLVLLCSLIAGIFVGFPIAFTLIILATGFGYAVFGDSVFYQMYFQTLGIMKASELAAAPLFIFMGHILERAGLMARLFRSFQFILAPVRGSLYLGVLGTATLFATATGIIGASITVMGMMAAPAMTRAGYDPRMSAGVIAAGGCLGILIPPSVMLLVMGPIIGVLGHRPVRRRAHSGPDPGRALYIGYAMIRSFLNPELGPPLPPEDRATSIGQIFREFFSGIVPLAVIMFSALGQHHRRHRDADRGRRHGSARRDPADGGLSQADLAHPARRLPPHAHHYEPGAVPGRRLEHLRRGVHPARHRQPADQLHARAARGPAVPARHPDGGHLHSRMAAGMAGGGVHLPPGLRARGAEAQLRPGLVQHARGRQPADGVPVAAVAMAAYYLRAVAPHWSLGDIYRGMAAFMCLQVIGLAIVFFFPGTATWLPSILFDR